MYSLISTFGCCSYCLFPHIFLQGNIEFQWCQYFTSEAILHATSWPFPSTSWLSPWITLVSDGLKTLLYLFSDSIFVIMGGFNSILLVSCIFGVNFRVCPGWSPCSRDVCGYEGVQNMTIPETSEV